MLVVPLIFSALVLGVAGLGDLRSLGRIGLKTLAYTVVVSAIAVLLGVVAGQRAAARRRACRPRRARGSPAGAAERAAAARHGAGAEDRHRPADPDRARQPGQGGGRRRHAGADGLRAAARHRPVADAAPTAARRFEEALAGPLRRHHAADRAGDLARADRRRRAALHAHRASSATRSCVQLARYVGVVLLALAIHQFVVYSLAVALPRRHEPAASSSAASSEAMLTAFSTASSATPRCRPRSRSPRRTSSCRRRSAASC